MSQTLILSLDLTLYAVGLAAVASGALGSLDRDGVEKLFGDPESLQSGRLQLFALQYYLYLGVLHGILVYHVCLLSALLPTPIAVAAALRVRLSARGVRGYS